MVAAMVLEEVAGPGPYAAGVGAGAGALSPVAGGSAGSSPSMADSLLASCPLGLAASWYSRTLPLRVGRDLSSSEWPSEMRKYDADAWITR